MWDFSQIVQVWDFSQIVRPLSWHGFRLGQPDPSDLIILLFVLMLMQLTKVQMPSFFLTVPRTPKKHMPHRPRRFLIQNKEDAKSIKRLRFDEEEVAVALQLLDGTTEVSLNSDGENEEIVHDMYLALKWG